MADTKSSQNDSSGEDQQTIEIEGKIAGGLINAGGQQTFNGNVIINQTPPNPDEPDKKPAKKKSVGCLVRMFYSSFLILVALVVVYIGFISNSAQQTENQIITPSQTVVVGRESTSAPHAGTEVITPDNAQDYYLRGRSYYLNGDYDPAIADYTSAIKLQSDYADAYYNRGQVYNSKGWYNQALYDLNKAIDLKSNLLEAESDVYRLRGQIYYQTHQFEAALADYHRYEEITGTLEAFMQAQIEEIEAVLTPAPEE